MIALKASRDAIIEGHHYLCARAARKFFRDGVERADLEQIAAIGLIKAADRYDERQGTPFEAYAWVLILGELMHYVRDAERLVRAPRRIRDLERRWASAERQLWTELSREPKAAEVVAHLGLSAGEERDVQGYRQARAVMSMDTLLPYQHGALSYTIDQQLDQVMLESVLKELSSIERQVLVEIYQHDTPVQEIAQRLGYSRRHIARLHRGALKKLSPLTSPMSA
ncbi:MAG: sigma-70 family RNA polymerase sigma factor [Candidatus Eremiobacteraeota bacterium]|nr:sigma-70 family RNA polymerase sigma factor [Candidatus Eremiobacteraeota bacterium]